MSSHFTEKSVVETEVVTAKQRAIKQKRGVLNTYSLKELTKNKKK